MHGMSLSIIARGPCFNSPLKIPSECMYVNSLIFYMVQTMYDIVFELFQNMYTIKHVSYKHHGPGKYKGVLFGKVKGEWRGLNREGGFIG